MPGARTFCVGLVLYRNEHVPKAWVLTGCMWAELTPDTMQDMARAEGQWRDQGYRPRLECIELRSAYIVLHTTYIRQLQRAWRRKWRRSMLAWLRARAVTGARRPCLRLSYPRGSTKRGSRAGHQNPTLHQ